MRLVKLDQLTGNEILAKAVLTEDYQELLAEGTQIKLGYLPKLVDLGITEVFVKDNEVEAQAKAILKKEVSTTCKEKVKEIISKHTYKNTKGMEEITTAAENIITNIVDDDNVVEQIYDIKERSSDLYEHSLSTCSMAVLVGLKMKLKQDQVHDLGVGCLLHDIGLRYVTIDYSNVDIENSETEKETEEYHKHTVYGYSALKNEEWLSKKSKEIILCHHEREDGSGYPLRAKELPVEIKIASLCDYFDESICGIGYQRKKVYEVVEYLKNFKGLLFDARVVDVLLDFIAVYPSGSKVMINTGEIAVVIKQNSGFPERPVIQIVTSKSGDSIEKAEELDLLKANNIFIDKVIN